ncbi:unnamed protein product, partial [Prorocentrum cordatum]
VFFSSSRSARVGARELAGGGQGRGMSLQRRDAPQRLTPRRGAAAQPDPLAAVAAAPPSARTRSCLQPRDQILVPELAALRRAEDSLRADQERLHSKYRFMQPNPVSAR